MKKTIRILSALLTVLLLGAFFSSCGEEKPKENNDNFEVISDQCVPLFNSAVEQYLKADCRSAARATATGVEDGKTVAYVQSFESLMHNRADEKKIVSKYCVALDDPQKVTDAELLPFFDCYVQKGVCYYDFADETPDCKRSFFDDYLSEIGLYAFSDRMPRSVYAVIDGDVIRLSMTFSPEDCAEMEKAFIATMTTPLFGSAANVDVSALSITAFLDAETHRFLNYTVSFTATVPSEPDVKLSFGYVEEFSDYGTTEGVVFPDLSAFPEKDPSEVTG